MALPSINPTKTIAWQELNKHFAEIQNISMQEMFAKNPERVKDFHIQWDSFLVDFSKNRISKKTIQLLLELANQTNLKQSIADYFSGSKINVTENRAVLHTALRANLEPPILLDNKNIIPEIQQTKHKINVFCDQIINGTTTGYTNKAFTDIVNIGVGGSDLGPNMVVEALQYYKNHLRTHFVSNIDGDHVQEIINKLNPETTLFIIVSKSFTTQETLTNATTIKQWFLQTATQQAVAKHFIAVSSAVPKAIAFGIAEHNVFPMCNWVGGRFSLWSAVGLSISLSIGYKNFEELLAGANKMDTHFKETPFNKNIPVLLALLSVWYNNFFEAQTQAIIPYTQYLQKLAPYLQQAIMESNGKNTDRNGNKVAYQTGTIIWGEPGTNSQHAFFQLLHQGTKIIPVDFIGFLQPLHHNTLHHNALMSNFFAQTEALLNGTQPDNAPAYKFFEGNKPSTTILIDQLTPANLGALIAMYEHKIFVEGIIWNIYSYDQWGVELGKQLANKILEEINNKSIQKHDSSTDFLLSYYLNK